MKNEMEMRFRFGGAIRSLEGRRLEVLACPYGSPADRDHLNEFFTERTDFMLEVGDRRPTLYFHGFTPDKRMTAKPFPIGVATASKADNDGLWMEVELKKGHLADRVWKSAEAGRCRASTGAVNYLCRSAKNGEVMVWPIGELSLMDEGLGRHPVNDKAVAIPLRASFKALNIPVPKAFGESAADMEQVFEALLEDEEGDDDMKPEELQAAMRAALAAEREEEAAQLAVREEMKKSIIDEMKGEPQYKALFSIQKETRKGLLLTPEEEKRGVTLEDKKEVHEYYWNLRHGIGGIDFRAIPLEETEATEGLPFVPQAAMNEIWLKRDAFSIARTAGIRVLQTDRLIFNIPRETTPMTAMAVIAEQGAYAANEVAFDLDPVTVVKRGSKLSATEELLEDQELFQAWINPAVGRSWGLGENVDLHAALITKAGVAIATKDVPTDAEIMGCYFALPQVYRNGACWFSADATMLYMRALLIATPRAYGDFPAFGGGEYETFMGKRFFTDANWKTLAVAVATDEFLGFANLNEACCLVERRGIKILVDPYTDAGTGVTNYYPSVRYVISAENTDAISNLTDLAD